MQDNLREIIRESIIHVISEADIIPNDNQANPNFIRNQSINAWRMIYCLMDDVKTAMDATWQDKEGRITNQDVDKIIDYIYYSIQNVTSTTIGQLPLS